MKIIHVIQGTYWRGAEIFFFDLANELSRRGISQHIIILDGGSAPRLSFQGCSVSQLPSGRSLMQRILWLGTDIMKVSQAEAASVICHGQSPLKNVVYASFFGLLRFPPIITIKIGESLPWIKNLKTLRIKFNRILLKKADTIVALGEKQELELLNVFKVSPKLIKVIPNGRTPPDEAQNLSRTRQQNQILIVGALAPEKNHLLAFDVLSNVRKTYPDTRLVVLGDGPLRAFLKTRAYQRFGSNVIEFKGHLNDVWPLFFESTLLLLCSKTEGLPGVLVEAAFAGLPVVAWNVGDVSKILENGENGFLTPYGNSEELAASIKRLLSDKSLRDAMSIKSKQIANSYSISTIADQYLDVIWYAGRSNIRNKDVRK